MAAPFEELILYLRLAQAYKLRLRMPDRDRALVMAGTAAFVAKLPEVAEFCRQLILQNNQGHMLRKYESFGDACDDSDFGIFLKQVRRKLAPERAESQLVELGFTCDVRESDYSTKQEFIAAVMGVDVEWLQETFGS